MTSSNTTIATDNRTSRLIGLGALAAAAATAVNMVIYGIGRAADIAYIADASAGAAGRIRLVHVVSLSLISFAIGLAAAVVANRWLPRALRPLQVVAGVLAVVSTWSDFTIDGGAGATVTLALMHLVVGVAYIATVQAVRTPPKRTAAAAHPVMVHRARTLAA